MLAVARPEGGNVIRLIMSQIPLVPAGGGIHDVDLPVAIPVGGEGNHAPVRRPGRGYVIRLVAGQVPLVPPGGSNHSIDLPVAVPIGGEGNMLAVR